jgi:two-component system OmpR family response regulator
MRVLLVEDDRMIGEAVCQALKDASYAVDWVRDGQAAINTLAEQDYGVMLLDLGLPKKDGMEVLQSIRARGNGLPVLVITARDGLQDRIQGLDQGADDYVLKPFEMTELLARMRAIVRRKGGTADGTLTNGVLTLDLATKEAKVGSVDARLSGKEFSLLQALLLRPGAILSRAELEDRLYGWGDEVESNAVEFLIHALRKKLGSDAIKNVRGVGWMVSKKT